MKILLCHERFVFRYGVDRVLLALAREFRVRGHHVTLLGLIFDDAAGSAECADRIVRVPAPADTLAADVTVAEWIAGHWEEHFAGANRPDVVVDAGWPFFSAIPIFESHGCRVVFQDHGIIPKEGMPEIGWRTLHLVEELKHAFVRRASAIVAVSAFIRDTQSRAASEPGQPLLVIPNGIDHLGGPGVRETPADPGADVVTVRFGAPPNDTPRILCTGRFEPGLYKQSELVFALEQRVRAWAPESWIGTLATREALDAAAGPGHRSRVVPFGQPDDDTLAQLVRASDVVVCFSRWEGYNLPLAEAQVLGRPCLVFNIGAHAEVVADPWQLCAGLDEMAAKIRALVDGTAPLTIRDGSVFCAWRDAPERRWASVGESYLGLFEGVHDGSSFDVGPVEARARPSVLIDVTNAVRDPANSGCVRVARRLAAEWQAYLDVTFVVWERGEEAFRFPTAAEFGQLGAYRGPVRTETHPVSEPAAPSYLEPWLVRVRGAVAAPSGGGGGGAAPGWLLLPEIRHRPDLWPILEFAGRMGLRTASIFHDAIPLERPELVPDPAYREGHADYMRGLSRVDVCVGNSGTSAEALRAFWRAEGLSGRVTSCLLPGGLPGERPIADQSDAMSARGAPFILMVSTLEPRKGFRRLIDAFLALRAQTRRSDWRLVLVGGRSWWSEDIARFVEDAARAHPEVTWLENAPDDRLEQLYRTCAFTVYASEIEGFGLPIMESVWHGRPCLCHDAGVMRELAAAGGCLTADLLAPAAFQAALLQLMDGDALRRRLAAECRARSVKRWCDFAAEFWARLAYTRWAELESPAAVQIREDEAVAPPVAGRLSFVVPTYNRLDLLQVCLGTLRETLPAGLDAEIIVVDDASSDGTRSWLQRGEGAAHGLRVLRHATNRGYGSSVNHAARVASGERLVLLNHDLSFRPGWLEPMLDAARSRPGVFAVGNIQCSAHDGSLDHAGIVFDPTGHPEHFRAELAWLQRRPEREFPAITFACALVERTRYLALGGLDSRFLNGFEDVDLCLRARGQGWPCVVANASVVDHQISATPGRKLAEAENRHRFFARWQAIAVVLGRDWEERLAWERACWAGVPDDSRPSGPCRVLVDVTSLAASDAVDTVKRVCGDKAFCPVDEGGPRFVPLFIGHPEQISSIVAAVPAELAGVFAGPEIWAFVEHATTEGGVSGDCRVVSGPAITVARRLQADVVYAPAERTNFASPDIPTFTAGSISAQSRAAKQAHPHSPTTTDLASCLDEVFRVHAAHRVTWRWADAAPRDTGSRDLGREASRPELQASPDKILCCIDEPVRWEEPVPLIEIRGWCVHRDGAPLTGIIVRTATGRTWRGVMGRARPDVAAALPGILTAGTSGFSVRVPASAGPFELWAVGAGFAVPLRTWGAFSAAGLESQPPA